MKNRTLKVWGLVALCFLTFVATPKISLGNHDYYGGYDSYGYDSYSSYDSYSYGYDTYSYGGYYNGDDDGYYVDPVPTIIFVGLGGCNSSDDD